MSGDPILKCLIAFVLGFLFHCMIRGNGLSVGGIAVELHPESRCMNGTTKNQSNIYCSSLSGYCVEKDCKDNNIQLPGIYKKKENDDSYKPTEFGFQENIIDCMKDCTRDVNCIGYNYVQGALKTPTYCYLYGNNLTLPIDETELNRFSNTNVPEKLPSNKYWKNYERLPGDRPGKKITGHMPYDHKKITVSDKNGRWDKIDVSGLDSGCVVKN